MEKQQVLEKALRKQEKEFYGAIGILIAAAIICLVLSIIGKMKWNTFLIILVFEGVVGFFLMVAQILDIGEIYKKHL